MDPFGILLPRRLALERTISIATKELESSKSLLTKLKEVQQYAKKHEIDRVEFGSNTVTRFTEDLKKVVRAASSIVHDAESILQHLEDQRRSGITYRPISRRENNSIQRELDEMERKIKRSKKRKSRSK